MLLTHRHKDGPHEKAFKLKMKFISFRAALYDRASMRTRYGGPGLDPIQHKKGRTLPSGYRSLYASTRCIAIDLYRMRTVNNLRQPPTAPRNASRAFALDQTRICSRLNKTGPVQWRNGPGDRDNCAGWKITAALCGSNTSTRL